jgi:ElaB/YqjD/DUF883 family membrane-anchored ribosome-binding protein
MDPKTPGVSSSGISHGNGNGNGSRTETKARSAHAPEAPEFVSEGFERMRVSTEEMSERVSAFIRERPVTAVVIALCAGVMVGRLLRL